MAKATQISIRKNKLTRDVLIEKFPFVQKSKRPITKRIKTFEDACCVAGVNPIDVLSFRDTKDEIAYKKLKIIVRALNERWIPDWENEDERKFYPYFKMGGSSFGFANAGCGSWNAFSAAGSRLCFKSEKLAKYAGGQFEDIYKDYLIINK